MNFHSNFFFSGRSGDRMDNFGYLIEEIVGISDFKNEFMNSDPFAQRISHFINRE